MSETEKGKSAEAGKKPAINVGLGFSDGGLDDEAASAEKSASKTVVDINQKQSGVDKKRAELREAFDDIRQRARAMNKEVRPDFREVKYVQGGLSKPVMSDSNIMDAFEVLFGGEGAKGRPYFDTFRGLTVGWNGQVIDAAFDLSPLVDALVTFELPQPSYDRVEHMFKRFARKVRMNSLTARMEKRIPEWDGVPRASMELITRFESMDTEMSREFGLYFWLSLYCRAMYPGCNASMVLALFGSGGNGKSYLAKQICEEMIGSESADAIVLDWSLDFNDFLRKITGQSVIANVAEMAGFNRAEMTKIKNLTTKTVDSMHYKFERENTQQRQWIMIMDGNEYKGLQRDETGNRRFYPMFVGQLPFDGRGQPQWKDHFYVNFDGFREAFWQIMAECRAWIGEHGMAGYNRYVAALEKKVKAFSENEMKMDRGTVRDDDLEMYIMPALRVCPVHVVGRQAKEGAGRPSEHIGAYIKANEIRNALASVAPNGVRFIPGHIKTKVTALGAEPAQINNTRVYLWRGIIDAGAWTKMLDELDGGANTVMVQGKTRDEGF